MMSYSLMHACIPYRSHAHAQDLILASSAGSSLVVTITIIVDTSAQVSVPRGAQFLRCRQ